MHVDLPNVGITESRQLNRGREHGVLLSPDMDRRHPYLQLERDRVQVQAKAIVRVEHGSSRVSRVARGRAESPITLQLSFRHHALRCVRDWHPEISQSFQRNASTDKHCELECGRQLRVVPLPVE